MNANALNARNTMNANAAPAPMPAAATPVKYKHEFARKLVEAMIGNLTANNANPEAYEAAKSARDAKFAADAAPSVPVAGSGTGAINLPPVPKAAYSKGRDVSDEARDSRGRWTASGSSGDSGMGPLKKGERIRIKPEWQDEGDDELEWYVHEDEDGGRVSIYSVDDTAGIRPHQRVESRMVERFKS